MADSKDTKSVPYEALFQAAAATYEATNPPHKFSDLLPHLAAAWIAAEAELIADVEVKPIKPAYDAFKVSVMKEFIARDKNQHRWQDIIDGQLNGTRGPGGDNGSSNPAHARKLAKAYANAGYRVAIEHRAGDPNWPASFAVHVAHPFGTLYCEKKHGELSYGEYVLSDAAESESGAMAAVEAPDTLKKKAIMPAKKTIAPAKKNVAPAKKTVAPAMMSH